MVDAPKHPCVSYQTHISVCVFDGLRLDVPWQCPVPGCEFLIYVRLAQASNLHRYNNMDPMVIPTPIEQKCQAVDAGYVIKTKRKRKMTVAQFRSLANSDK